MISDTQKRQIIDLSRAFSLTFLGVFGSCARGEETEESDLDLLIDFENTINLLEFVRLKQELSDKIGIKVDLVSRKSINKYLEPYIKIDFILIL